MIILRNFRLHSIKTFIAIVVVLLICTFMVFPLWSSEHSPPVKMSAEDSLTSSPEMLTSAILAELANQDKEDATAIEYYSKLAVQTKNSDYARRAVALALEDNHYDLAIKPAELWTQLSPDSREAQQILTSLLMSQNQFVSAQPHLEKMLVLSVNPADVSHYAENLSSYTRISNSQLTVLIEGIHQAHPNDPQMSFNLSILAGQLGDLNKAIALVDESLTQKPDQIDAIAWKAQLAFKKGDKQGALDLLKNSADKTKNTQLELLQAEFLVNMDQLQEAKAVLKTIRPDAATQSDIWLYSAEIAKREKNYPETIANLEKLEKVSDKADVARNALGELYESIQQPDKAIDWYLKVTKDPYYFSAQMKAADLLYSSGKMDEGLHILKNLNPSSYAEAKQLYLLQAEILLKLNEPENALQILNKALGLIPNDIQFLYYRALSAQQLEAYDIVEKDLKQIITQDPKQVNALNILGFILTNHTTRYQEAAGYISQALTLQPDNPSILDSMGWVEFHLGDSAKAIQYLRAAYQRNPADEIGVHLAEVLWKTGDRTSAQNLWDKMLVNTSNSQELTLEIQRVKKETP